MGLMSLLASVRWLIRELGRKPNPLRRPVDRLAAAVIAVLLAAGLAAVPAAAAWGNVVYERELSTAATETATRHQVDAVVATEPEIRFVGGDPYQHTELWADVRWSGPDGRLHTASVEVTSTSVVGSQVPIWVDQADHKTTAPPRTEGQVRVSAVLSGVAVMVMLQTLCGVLIVGVRAIADGRARRAWERDWEVVEPRWTRQQH